METYKLHVRVGSHEFSGEGPEEAVRRDFEEWKAMVASAATNTVGLAGQPTTGGTASTTVAPDSLTRVFAVDENRDLVTLRVLPRSEERDSDALLLVLLGSKLLKGQEELSVIQLKAALKQSGCKLDRIDYVASPYLKQGLVNKGGIGKGGRYSLTNAGLARAEQIVAELVS